MQSGPLVPAIAERFVKLSYIPCSYSNYETDNSSSHNEVIISRAWYLTVSWASVSAVVQYISRVVDVVCM